MAGNKFDKKKVDQFKTSLVKLRNSLLHDIDNMSKNPGSQNSDSGDVSGHVLHMADVATDMYDREFNLGLASTEREVLQKIEQALKRVDDKIFGACSECEKSIPLVRLNAIPYVETCLKCQEEIETKK